MSLLNPSCVEDETVASSTVARSVRRGWCGRACLMVSFVLSGCLKTLPTLPEQESNPNTPDTAVSTDPPSQRSDATGNFLNVQQALPAENLTIAPEKTTNLWERIRAGFKVPLPGGEAAQRVMWHERWYLEHPERLERILSGARLHMFNIVEAVGREGLPMEVALLPAVEGEFIPMARSSAAADGLWGWSTFAPAGRRYFLKSQMFSDEHRDAKDITQGAMRYLKELQARYDGDFQLALAAYNCGEEHIDSQVRKAKARGLHGRFEDLKLDLETANYVPRLLALAKLLASSVDSGNTEGITLPTVVNAP